MTHDAVTTLWGKNGSNQVFYLSCPTAQISIPGAWSAPVPLVTGVERISAYVNRADGGNTIFTSGGGKLQKLIQATDTVAKVWSSQEIKLSTPSRQQLLSFNSYTTVIYVANADDVPVRGIELSISAKARKPVYINGLYYVLGKSPVTVKTDAMGSVMITEVTEDINSAVFTVSTDNGLTKTDISPTDKSFQKLATLDSESALRGATLPVGIIAGGIVGSPQSAPLIASTTP